MKYYYTTNSNGTTYEGFRPFAGDPGYAEAPDWVPDDRECGQALHVVEGNPWCALRHVNRDGLRAYAVEPVDARPKRCGKIRCRAVRVARELTTAELSEHAKGLGSEGANLAAKCGHVEALRVCIAAGVLPTRKGAGWAAECGHVEIGRASCRERV